MKTKFDMKQLEAFFKKLSNPNAAHDLNAFLEKMPANAGQTMLIVAGVTWALAGAAGIYANLQAQELTTIQSELQAAQALQPVVPKLNKVRADKAAVQKFVEGMQEVYRGINVKPQGHEVLITAGSTANFGQFREAVNHVQNGGQGWVVSVDKMCVGRECARNPLQAILAVNTVKITSPAS